MAINIDNQTLRIIIVILLFAILIFHLTFLIILGRNYKSSGADTTKSIFFLFVSLTVMLAWKIAGFFARIVPEHPEIITTLLVLDIGVLLAVIWAEIRFMRIVCGFSIKQKIKGWLDDS